MAASLSSNAQSYFDLNTSRVESAPALKSEKPEFRSLLISFLTIESYRDLLFAEDVNLNDIEVEFLNDVMRVDFNRVIRILLDYAGNERKGVHEALKRMDAALKNLYDSVNNASKPKQKIKDLLACRMNLHVAFQQLEHLKRHALN